MRSWKKSLNNEIDSILPDLREDVKNHPIAVKKTDDKRKTGPFGKLINSLLAKRKRLIPILSACLVFAIAIPLIINLIPAEADGDLTGAISVEINPQAVFVTDSNGIIVSVTGMNRDADMILVDETRKNNIIGKDAKTGISIYTDYAAMLGYLDLSKEDAIRISTCGSEKLLSQAESALKDYLCAKGSFVAVIGDILEVDSFCERANIYSSPDKLESLISDIISLSDLSYERDAQSSTKDELQSVYKEEVLVSILKKHLESRLEGSIDTIKQSIEDVFNILSLSIKIIEHEDNPALLLKDYWSVKNYCTDLDGEFGELVSQMDDAVQDYKLKYGKELSSYSDFISLYTELSSISLDILNSFLNGMDDESYLNNISYLIDALTRVGIDTEEMSMLASLPESPEEYIIKMKRSCIFEAESKIEKNSQNYVKELPEISRGDYDRALDGIISSYGSLENYWNAIKNK